MHCKAKKDIVAEERSNNKPHIVHPVPVVQDADKPLNNIVFIVIFLLFIFFSVILEFGKILQTDSRQRFVHSAIF